MTPKFDKYNDTYSVKIDSNVNILEINYKAEDNYEVYVQGNSNLQEGENKVFIEVKNSEEANIYTLLVTKESTKVFETIDVGLETIEVEKELPNYVAPLIGIICFLLIIICHSIIFKKKKHK